MLLQRKKIMDRGLLQVKCTGLDTSKRPEQYRR